MSVLDTSLRTRLTFALVGLKEDSVGRHVDLAERKPCFEPDEFGWFVDAGSRT